MRRLVLPFVAAALLVAAWAAAPATPDEPAVREFSLPIDLGKAPAVRAAGRTEIVSAVQRAPRRFDLLGLTMDEDPRGLHAHVRTRLRGGDWTPWTELHAQGHAEEGGKPPRTTEPVWVGGADELQLRLARRPRGLKAFLVDVSGARRALRARAAAAPRHQGPGTPPAIIPRDQWAGENCQPRSAPVYGRVQLAFVHHTVSANDYSPEESAAMVLGICRYHRDANKWNDLGYNFIVDQYGQVFEGRAGGIDRAVTGAQAQGYNSESTGIATLGTFTDIPFPQAGLDAVARLIGWKLPLSGAPTFGQVTVISQGGPTNRFPEGTPVTLERIAGHRDANGTECPGGALYGQLPALRALVGNRSPLPGVTVPAPPTHVATSLDAASVAATVAYPAAARLSGRLTLAGGAGVAGAPVRIDVRGSDGKYRRIAATQTNADGSWAVNVATAFSRTLRAVFPGDPTRAPATSRPVGVKVAAGVRLRASRDRIPAGRRADLRGKLRPIKRDGLTVVVERKAGNGYVHERTLRVRPRGADFRALARLERPALYRFRARFAGDKTNAPATSPFAFIRVTRTRGQRLGGATAD